VKIKFTDQQRAAILAGDTEIEVDAETLAGTKPPAKPAGTEAEASAAAAATAAAAAAATAAAEAAAKSQSLDLVTHLKSEISTLQAANLAANVELTNLKASTAAATAASEGLVSIARGSVSVMQIALGGSSTTEKMSAADLVAEHARVEPQFKAKFKMGGVASASTEDGQPNNVVPLNAEFAARLASTTR
jgi:hypothetical protein